MCVRGVKHEPVTLNTVNNVTAMFCENFQSKLFTLRPYNLDPQNCFHSSNMK